jgi:hypothetical protein
MADHDCQLKLAVHINRECLDELKSPVPAVKNHELLAAAEDGLFAVGEDAFVYDDEVV